MGTNRGDYPSLLQNSFSSPNNYGSVNSNFSSESEQAIMDGTSIDGKMSISRRFFILLTVFDVLFTFLVWLICTMVSGEFTIATAFKNEVINYSIQSSMFDVVILAVVRFILIVLFYAFIRISHWWIVAITTAGSGAFIIAKVFLYQWVHSSKTASVVLLLCSFVLSWGEAWFLDFRVIPSENKALNFLAKQDIERVPVISHPALSRSQSDDGSAFYSPPGSDGEDNARENDGSTVSEVEWLSPKGSTASKPADHNYRKLAEDALKEAVIIIKSDGWKKEKCEGEDTIFTKFIPAYGKVFKFVGTIQLSPEKVLNELYFKGEDMHKWNPTVKKVKIVQKIDKDLDIAHVIATEGAAGLVASRDFVNLRIWKKQHSSFVHASVGTTHLDVPVNIKYVRGEQGPCVYIIDPVGEDSSKCRLQWLLNTNLKGWIPQYLIDQTLSTVMMEYIASLRKHANSVNQNV